MHHRDEGEPIPLARPNVGPREAELIQRVLDSGSLSMGSYTAEFEESLAAMVGRRHGIACSSGTAGLHLIVRALNLKPGDEVITTPFSFVASSNCAIFEGATPRFVDIEETTLGIDPSRVMEASSPSTRAIVAVDVFGMPCRLVELDVMAREQNWHLIEDSCEALGSRLGDRAAGSFGVASVFAFYPNKQITTGEGGMVLTDDDGLAAAMRSLRNQGRDEDGTWLRHVQLGYNYRIDELSAALGVAQLERYEELRDGRARVVEAYRRELDGCSWLALPSPPADATVDWFVYVVRVADSVDRDEMLAGLAARGVPARPYFSPIHLQPFYRERFGYGPGDFPVTERVARSTLAIPFSSMLTDDQVRRVASALIAAAADQGVT